MRCCVPFCKNTSDNVSEAEGKRISFHGFPNEAHLCTAWLRVLGKQDSHLRDSAVVCSQHFLNDDIYETESGLRQIGTGAIPSTVQVCMICLDTDSKLFLMSKHKLEEAYEKLTGHPLHDQGNLKQTVCIQCAQRLINFSRFRDKSLRARALMMDLVEKHELITRRHIKMINRTKHQLKSNMVLTTLGPDYCDLHILEHSSEDKQTELEETHHRGVVKTEGSDDSMLEDGDMQAIHEDDNNINDFAEDRLKYESVPYIGLETFVHEHGHIQHVPDHCDLHILEHPSEDKQTELEETHHRGVVKTEGTDDSMSVDGDMQAIHEDDNNINNFAEDRLKYESAPYIGLQKFVHEHGHIQHVRMHLQNSDGTSQVCKPRTAVSSSSSHSSLITENKQADPSPSAHRAQTAVAPLSMNLALKNEIEVSSTEESATNISCRYKIQHCFFKLYDVMKVVPTQDRALMKAQNAVRSSITDTDTVKVIVSKSFKSETNFLNNIVSLQCNNSTQSSKHSEKISLICDICRKIFKQKSLLVKHVKTHSIIKRFSCALCEYKCTQNRDLILHMRTHTCEKPFICMICNYQFAQNSNLVRHMRTHTGEKSHSCKICNSKFAQHISLVKHMRTHTGEKPYSCKICKSKYAQHISLVNHMRTHTGEKPYSCKICDSKFAKNSKLVRHMRTHTGEKPYSCKICDSKFAQSNNLVNHMRTHTGEKPYSCKICDSKFARNSTLVLHMRTHTGEKPYSCKICDTKFAQYNTLVSHMRTHTGEKPYSCKICDRKFAQNSNLVLHMRTHTGEKPYSCNICDSKFAQNSHLVLHMRTHTGEKLYSCKICDSKFARNSNLVSHMRTHTCEKPFICKICNYQFAQNNNLVRHMRTHTGEK